MTFPAMNSAPKPTEPSDRWAWSLASFLVPLLVLLGLGSFGLWREREAGAAERARQLAWEARSAAEVASPGYPPYSMRPRIFHCGKHR